LLDNFLTWKNSKYLEVFKTKVTRGKWFKINDFTHSAMDIPFNNSTIDYNANYVISNHIILKRLMLKTNSVESFLDEAVD
jgi:hypothetical protein